MPESEGYAGPPSPGPPRGMPRRLCPSGPAITIAAIAVVTVGALRAEGRVWWCECRTLRPWIGDVWTSHCSQHLLDPYSITHLSHGLLFWMALAALAPRLSVLGRLCIAVAIAAAWEVLENSPIIIERYRSATMSLDYMGDSTVNAMGDILCCVAGFVLARAIGWRWALGLFVATEVLLLILIRDNLTLNVLMLIYPVDAIKAWQAAGQ